jgi:transcription elongation factor GreB
MSKAFTKESETDTEAAEPEPNDPLPAGFKNYVTPNGLRLLRDELDLLRRVERPKVVEVVAWAAGNGDRLRYLLKRIDSAEVVDPARQKSLDRVFFGATVTYVDADGAAEAEESALRIVGIDEASAGRGAVSWVSPIARALMKAEEGDVVALSTPNGTKRLEVVKIAYEGD